MVRQNKLIANPNSKIFDLFSPIPVCLVSWVYLLLFSTIYQANAIDPANLFFLITTLIVLLFWFIYVTDLFVKGLIIFLAVIVMLLSPIGYLTFKYSINNDIYVAHNNNYLLIDRKCYLSNHILLDLNNLAHPYEKTKSFYYIESFSKIINPYKLIVKEEVDIKSGRVKMHSIDLINCTKILVEDCTTVLNSICKG